MNEEQKYTELEKLKDELNKVKAKLKISPANLKLGIKRDRLKREIKELKMTMTDEDWEHFLSERSEIDVRKING